VHRRKLTPRKDFPAQAAKTDLPSPGRLFKIFQVFAFAAAVTRSVSRRLGSFGASRRVFDNFNGAESPWVRLVALLDLSETRPLSATADSMENRQLELPFYRNTVLTGQFNRPVSTA